MDHLDDITRALTRPSAVGPVDGLGVRVLGVRVVPRREPPVDPTNPRVWVAELEIRFAVDSLPDGTAWLPWRGDVEVIEVIEELGNWARAHVDHHRPRPARMSVLGETDQQVLWQRLLDHLGTLGPVTDRGDGVLALDPAESQPVSIAVTPELWHDHLMRLEDWEWEWEWHTLEEAIFARDPDESWVVVTENGIASSVRRALPPVAGTATLRAIEAMRARNPTGHFGWFAYAPLRDRHPPE